MPDEEDLGWAKELVDEGAHVMHLPTRSVGKVAKLYDGDGALYVSTVTREATRAPVIELATGASFVASRGAFIRMQEHEAAYYEGIVQAVRDFTGLMGKLAVDSNVLPTSGVLLIAAALRAQAAALESKLPQAAPPDGVAL